MGHATSKDYQLLDGPALGSGAFGTVKKVRCRKTGQIFALKKIRVGNREEKEAAIQEASVLSKLHHPNLLKAVTFYEHKSWRPWSDNTVAIILELCDRGNLARLVERREPLSEAEILSVLIQIARGLTYLHSENVLHRDLKPENVLIRTNPNTRKGLSSAFHDVKLADLGLSALLVGAEGKARETWSVAGTQPYMAPEVQRGQRYSFSADIFSLGRMAGELITGQRCWRTQDQERDISAATRISLRLRELVLQMLNPRSQLRPSARAVLQQLLEVRDHRGASLRRPGAMRSPRSSWILFLLFLAFVAFCVVLSVFQARYYQVD